MELNITSKERDLGIIIDSELDFGSIYSKLLEKQIVKFKKLASKKYCTRRTIANLSKV